MAAVYATETLGRRLRVDYRAAAKEASSPSPYQHMVKKLKLHREVRDSYLASLEALVASQKATIEAQAMEL